MLGVARGTVPHETDGVRKAPYLEIVRVIRKQAPKTSTTVPDI